MAWSLSLLASVAATLAAAALALGALHLRLRARERQLRRVLELAPDLVVRFDRAHRVRYANAAFARHAGLDERALRGRHLRDLGAPERIVQEWEATLRRVLRTGEPASVEFTVDATDGARRFFEARVVPEFGSGRVVTSAIGIIRDVSERRSAEERLRRSEAYLAEGQRLSHTGSWAWNLATGARYWSREMHRIYGFPPADRPPEFAAVLARAHPDDAPVVDRTLREAFASGSELRLLTRVCVPGERTKWVQTYGHPVRDAGGSVVEYIGTVVDVTERVRGTQRLRRAYRERYTAVLAERTRIARDMHDGLLQDLAGIAMQVGALLPHLRDAPGMVERVARIVREAERAGRDARVALQGMRHQVERIDLVGAVERTARGIAAPASLTLGLRVSGAPRGATALLEEAVTGIVHEAMTNVVKHAAATAVQVRVRFGRGRLRLAIRDDGRGLPPPTEDGARFGVVGMRERALEAGGSLSVTSAPGRGTTVRLDAPLVGRRLGALSRRGG